jgi:hypothetical protein
VKDNDKTESEDGDGNDVEGDGDGGEKGFSKRRDCENCNSYRKEIKIK